MNLICWNTQESSPNNVHLTSQIEERVWEQEVAGAAAEKETTSLLTQVGVDIFYVGGDMTCHLSPQRTHHHFEYMIIHVSY